MSHMERARRVLLVDERPGLAAPVIDYLHEHGFAVSWCEAGEAALQRLTQGDIGVVVLDLQMSGMHGLKLLERCRSLSQRVVTVVYAVQAAYEDVVAALNLGASALVDRRDEPSALLQAIDRASEALYSPAGERDGVSDCGDSPPCANGFARAVLESLGDAVLTTDASGVVDYLNPVAESLLGVARDEAIGHPVSEVFRLIDHSGRAISPAVSSCLQRGIRCRTEGYPILLRQDAAPLAVEEAAAPVRDAQGLLLGASVVFRDVSKARATAQRAAHDASHDALTGLVNRREFERRLSHAVMRAVAGGPPSALLYMDLDRFKQVNDSCGHAAGDQLLRQLSQVLLHCVRSRDTLARLGGDEFGLLLEGCSEQQAARIAELMLRAVADYRFLWEGRHFALGASIGLAPVKSDSESKNSLLTLADRACYAAKDAGRNCVVRARDLPDFCNVGGNPGGSRLRDALSRQNLCLAAQRIDSMHDGALPLIELFARLRAADGALIPPGAFIPMAERYSQMSAIDRQVVTLVCSWLRRNTAAVGKYGCVAINLSVQTLHDLSFADYVIGEFARHEVPLRMACFEIRETDALANLSVAHQLCERLRAEGARMALDDFGSGLGAIRLLKHLQVDYLKIDGSLIREICEDGVDLALVNSLVGIARELGVQTVAKFVEGSAVLERLNEIGVDYVQGDGVQATELVALGDDE